MPLRQINEWQPADRAGNIPEPLREIILDHHSLTQRLKQLHHQTFYVRVLCHDWQEPNAEEKHFLQCADQRASVREVLLYGSGNPVVFARSVLPQSSLMGENAELLTLDDKPLGEYIFNQPGLHRSHIEVASLPACQFNQYLDFRYQDEVAWARRSLFYVRDKPILVCEVFLPERQ